MPLFSFTFDETTYSVDLSFDDAALTDDSVAFELMATRHRNGQQDTVQVRVEISPWDNRGSISVDGVEAYQFDLYERGSSAFETFLQSIPVPDPILGCAIKAGISSLIGQAIKCRGEVERKGLWKMMQAFVGCMRDHFGDIGRTALRRAFGCMISGGFL